MISAKDTEGDQLVRAEVAKMCGFHFPGKLQANVFNGQRQVLLAVYDDEAKRLHLRLVLCIGEEVE